MNKNCLQNDMANQAYNKDKKITYEHRVVNVNRGRYSHERALLYKWELSKRRLSSFSFKLWMRWE